MIKGSGQNLLISNKFLKNPIKSNLIDILRPHHPTFHPNQLQKKISSVLLIQNQTCGWLNFISPLTRLPQKKSTGWNGPIYKNGTISFGLHTTFNLLRSNSTVFFFKFKLLFIPLFNYRKRKHLSKHF